MRTLVLVLLAFLTFVSVAPALSLVSGTIEDGYTWDGSYWWWGSDAYTRTLYQYPNYYYCGRCYPGRTYWYYTFHHTRPKVVYTDANWRTKLLELATNRDKYELDIRKGQFEQAYFMEAIRGLGLEGQFSVSGYGLHSPYSGYNSLQLSSAGANSNTVYGYSYNTISSLYGDTSLNQLYQQANRLADRQQTIASQANTEFNTLIGTEGSNRARVAEILAKGQAVQEMLRSLDSGVRTESKTFSFNVTRGPDGKMEVVKADGDASTEAVNLAKLEKDWQASAKQCLTCHSGKKTENGFDVTHFPTMTVEQKMNVLSRLTTSDVKKRMPRTADGRAGQLSQDELKVWMQAAQLKTNVPTK
jgi:hypothetical protein